MTLMETRFMQNDNSLQKRNNPDNEPVGHFTGRCNECHSKDLWDDCTAYGCNCCGATFMTGDIIPRLVNNLTGEVTSFNTWEEFRKAHE